MKEGTELKSVLKYPGAKNRLATWICGYIPKHDVYLEPFAGSLAVLLNKQRSHIETVNDIDEEIVNFFRILRDRSGELERVIEFTPFSRSEYKAAYEKSEDLKMQKGIFMQQGVRTASLYLREHRRKTGISIVLIVGKE